MCTRTSLMPWRPPARRKLIASRVKRAQMYALFDQLFPRQQELHAHLEVAFLDRVTESGDLGMVRRGSTVQVRQRAFAKFLHVSSFCLPVRRRSLASTSTERPPTSRGALGVASKPCW
jgi:hypothetical protein